MKAIRAITILTLLAVLPAIAATAQTSGTRRGGAQSSITITSNVNGANVYLNNAIVGTTPYTSNVNPGSYNVLVTATGYKDYSTTVTVNGPTTINVTLQPMNFSLGITSNVNGAIVFLNGQRMGQAPYTATLAPGTYELRVQANGYQNFSTQVIVNQSGTVNAQLEPMLATIQVQIPDNFLNANSEHGHGDRRQARNDIQVFVDNQRVNQDTFRVQQGNHTIRFESGSFMVQQSFFFNAGQQYVVSPQLTISVSQ